MSVLGLSGPPPPPPPVVSERDKSDRRIIRIIILLTIAIVLGSIGSLAFAWVHYSSKYKHIDRSHEALTWAPDPDHAVSTTYTNAAYGVSLTLPGRWTRLRPISNYFITLGGSLDGGAKKFDAALWPIFNGISIPIDTQSSSIISSYARNANWRLLESEPMQINGRSARVMSFATPNPGLSITLAIVPKGPVTYGLIFAGPGARSSAWQAIKAALPQAITIQ